MTTNALKQTLKDISGISSPMNTWIKPYPKVGYFLLDTDSRLTFDKETIIYCNSYQHLIYVASDKSYRDKSIDEIIETVKIIPSYIMQFDNVMGIVSTYLTYDSAAPYKV